MSNNLVNQSTKAISTNELRYIGPVLAVVSSGPMDLFLSSAVAEPITITPVYVCLCVCLLATDLSDNCQFCLPIYILT